MKTLLLFPLCLAFFALCLGGTFEVTTPTAGYSADSAHYDLHFPYVPDHEELEADPDYANNTEDYYLHIEYDANIISPIGIMVYQVADQPSINGSTSDIGTYSTNDNVFLTSDVTPIPTVTLIEAEPDMVVEILPPINAVQGIQITIIVTIENRGDRRPVDPSVDFVIPGDLIDLLGATANRPDVDINITEANGDFYFHITWLGGSADGAASDVEITIDLFVHEDACAEFAALNARRSFHDVRQASNNSTSSSSNETGSTGNSTSSSSLDCPDPGYLDNGDIDPRCRPQPRCPEDIENLLPMGACGGFCVQGVVYPNYLTWSPQRARAIVRRNFVDKLTDDPTRPGSEDPTLVFFFAFIPSSSSSVGGGGGDESTSLDLVIILLPLFLGLLLILCVSILLAALLAALWWFLTGREKMRTRVQWIPGRNKGGEDEGL